MRFDRFIKTFNTTCDDIGRFNTTAPQSRRFNTTYRDYSVVSIQPMSEFGSFYATLDAILSF
jgi:hypothetical protein